MVEAINNRPIIIRVNHGLVIITETDENHLEISGQSLFGFSPTIEVNTENQKIFIEINAKHNNIVKNSLQLYIKVPRQLHVEIDTDTASVFVQRYSGVIYVTSIAGNITVENYEGLAYLQSNRGNIIVRDSFGEVSIFGNYGSLTIQNTKGTTKVSSIMGDIFFRGLIHGNDSVHIETDHGAVSINLNPDSESKISVYSTSGSVVCMLSYINSTSRSCTGEYRAGSGTLYVRTVSGNVNLKLFP
ncbi:MAG: DUF4097 family beta strand repeat-containing protein [Chloroflexota bacterium]